MRRQAMFINYLFDNPSFYLSWVLVIIVSIVLHELAHGIAAIQQGDDTPRLTGHMTWDPMVHMGGMSLAFVAILGFGFGAMPVNPSRFRSRYGDAIVSFAGPAMNLLIALISLTILGLWMRSTGGEVGFGFRWLLEGGDGTAVFLIKRVLVMLGLLNIVLALLNLVPIPPLDGSNILANLSPGYRRIAQDPNNGMVWTACFIALFFLAGTVLFEFAARVSVAYVEVLL